jgi:hypothetical protein
MTESRMTGKEIQDEVLNTVRKSQAAVLDAIQTWVATVQSITPDFPEVSVPFSDRLPKPADLVANAYDFAEQLLASQRRFAEDVLRATGTLLPGKDETTTKKNGAAVK